LAAAVSLDALQVGLGAEVAPVALDLPEFLGEAVKHAVFGFMHITETAGDHALIELPDAGWPIGRDLLLQGDMQRHVKKRVALAALGEPFAAECGLALLKQAVILGVLLGNLEDLPLDGLEGLTGLRFAPGPEIGLAELVAILTEHEPLVALY